MNAVKKFHRHLPGATFEMHTDHKPLGSLSRAEIWNTKLQRWAFQIIECGAPIKYHTGKLNIRAGMLSWMATIQPIPELQFFALSATPEISCSNNIDPKRLAILWQQEFANEWVEAKQQLDTSPWITEDNIYSLAESYLRAGRYFRLIHPRDCLKSLGGWSCCLC